jgi:hypothetical protein
MIAEGLRRRADAACRALLDDFGNEIQITFHERRIPLIELVPIDFGHDVRAQSLRPVERVGHRCDPVRRYGLELVDQPHDARELGRDVGHLRGGDFQTREPTKSLDVFWAKHGFSMRCLSVNGVYEKRSRNEVIDFSLDNTRRLWIGLPVVKVPHRFS